MSGDSTPGTQEGKSTAAVSKPRRASAPRSLSGFQKIHRPRRVEVLTLLLQTGADHAQACDARRILQDLVMEADFRTGEVVGSGTQIARLLGKSRRTWHKWRDVLVAARLIEIRGVAVNGETDGVVFVSCLAWLSGIDQERTEQAPVQAPVQELPAPVQAPVQELHRHNAPTSGNTPQEVKKSRSEDKTTTARVVSEVPVVPADEVVVDPPLTDEVTEQDADIAVALTWGHIGLTGDPDDEVIEAARKRMTDKGWSAAWLAQVILSGDPPKRWSRTNLLHRIRDWDYVQTTRPMPHWVHELPGAGEGWAG